MSKTSAQLKSGALAILLGMPPDQDPSQEDMTAIGDYVAPMLDQLAEDGICVIGNVEDIPDVLFLPLVRLLANVAGPRFGSPMNEDAKLIDERTLRRLTAVPPTYEPIRTEYF